MTGSGAPELPCPAGPTAERALVVAARSGPFFTLQVDVGPHATSWSGLLDGADALTRRREEVSRVLGPAAGPRVVASLVHLGVVARLLSPAVATALTVGAVPVPDDIRVHLSGVNPVPMAWAGVTLVPAPGPVAAARALARYWLGPRIAPWTALMAAGVVSERVLNGNTASALAGAVALVGATRPDLVAPGAALVDACVGAGPLAGSGVRRPDGSFARSSCCLVATLPGSGTCGDCVLARPAPR